MLRFEEGFDKKMRDGSFLALGDCGGQPPGISLASENFQALYFTKK